MTSVKPLLLICLLALLPAFLHAQTFYPITATSGSQSFTGYNVAVTTNGSPTIANACGFGPYQVGLNGAQNGYIYTFNNPISDARIQVYGLNDNETMIVKVNGVVYPVSSSPTAGVPGTCGAVYTANFFNGNLSSIHNPVGSNPESGMQVTIHPLTSAGPFTTLEIDFSSTNNYGDGFIYNLYFAGNCGTPFNAPNINVCSGVSPTLQASTIAGASYVWSGPSSYSSNQQSPVLSNIQTSQSGTYNVTAFAGGCAYNASALVTVLQSPPVPVATVSPSVCSGDSLALSMNSITGVTYGWRGPLGFISSAQNYHILNIPAADSGWFYATDTAANGCVSVDSNFVRVHLSLPGPTISITSAVGDTICTGSSLTLAAAVTNASFNSTYQWMRGSNPVATTSSYTFTNVLDFESFRCMVTSNFGVCQIPTQATSTPFIIRVITNLGPPVATISVFTSGNMITFSAAVSNGGVNLGFQWMKNGSPIIGATTSSWETRNDSLAPGDKISLVVTSSFPCATPNTAGSNVVTVAVPQVTGTTDNISLYPNPSTGSLTLEGTLTLTNTVTAEVRDATGRMVYKETLPVSNGTLHKQLNLNALPGNYFMTIQSGTDVQTIPFTVVK